MNLVKKLIAPLMLTTAIISGVSGCSTVGPWKYDSESKSFFGASKNTSKQVGTKTTTEKTFNISDFYLLDGREYSAEVTESLREMNYSIVDSYSERQFQNITFEKQTTTIDGRIPTAVGVSVGGLVLGAIVGRANMNDSTKALDEESGLYLLGGAVLGVGAGILIAKYMPLDTKVQRREAKRKIETDSTFLERREEFSGAKDIYLNENVGSIWIGFAGKDSNYRTEEGMIRIFEEPNMYFTKEGLKEGLKSFPLMQQVKPIARKDLEEKILMASKPKEIEFIVETREKSFNPKEKIINCSKKSKMKFYSLEKQMVYSAVSDFVKEWINPQIKYIKFSVEDSLTHFPITNSSFKFEAIAPSASELVEDYFTGDLKKYAESIIPYYLTGRIALECPETIVVPAYPFSNINVEVVNPDYNFVTGSFEIEDDAEKKVYMIDKGQKVRVDFPLENSGRIE